ncbi:MAG: zinc-binding dehydrogenase [Ilumatobacteraceae bacterium]
MRAVLVDPQAKQLVVDVVPDPEPGRGQLLVRVVAAGVNRADLAITAGAYHRQATATRFGAGSELAGTVVAVGPGVDGFQVGDRVMSMGAGFAELAIVPAVLAMAVPAGLDEVAAGALPVALATMHDALVTHGGLTGGQHVVVNAASSGVGVVGVRIALHLGAATVVGTSRSAAKRAQLEELIGDDRFHVVAPDRLVATVEELTGSRGVDVIVDNVGAAALSDNVAAAAVLGRIVQVGRLGGRTATIDLDELARKRISLIGATFRTRTADERAAVVQAAWRDLAPAVASGAVVPHVHAEYALDEVPAAHAALARDEHVGKLVIRP